MIQDYIDYISLQRKELGGHAICPFAKSFLDKIQIIESTNFMKDVFECIQNKEHPMLYLIYGDPKQFDKKWLEEFCNDHQQFARIKDLWLIWDHPDQINKINGIETNNKEYAILLIQGLSELNKYSKRLHKTNYYEFWDKDYYDKIVRDRKKKPLTLLIIFIIIILMWNYRIIKDKDDSYGLYEVIYNDEGKITAHSEDAELYGDSPEDIVETLRLMLDDANKSYYDILESDKIKFAPMYKEEDLSEAMTLEEFKNLLDNT